MMKNNPRARKDFIKLLKLSKPKQKAYLAEIEKNTGIDTFNKAKEKVAEKKDPPPRIYTKDPTIREIQKYTFKVNPNIHSLLKSLKRLDKTNETERRLYLSSPYFRNLIMNVEKLRETLEQIKGKRRG